MVDLFADALEETIEDTLQTIRKNLDRVGLYGGHTLYRPGGSCGDFLIPISPYG